MIRRPRRSTLFPSPTLSRSKPEKALASSSLIFALSPPLVSSVAMRARFARHSVTRSGNRSPMATSSTRSDDVRQSFAAPVPRPPQPTRPIRSVSARRISAGAPGNVRAAAAAALVWTNSRRVTSRGCWDFRLMAPTPLGSGFADEAEADERCIGEPPAALRELRIGLVPVGRLPGSGGGADAVRRIVPRPAAHDGPPTRVRAADPLGHVAQHVVQAQRIGGLGGGGMGLGSGIAGVPGERVPALGGEGGVPGQAEPRRARPLGIGRQTVFLAGLG